MMIVGFFSWWYGAGWRDQASLVKLRFDKTADFFSFQLLLRSLFSPFRQISADASGRSLDAKFRAGLDKLISRFIGAGIRLVIMFVGLLAFLAEGIGALVRLFLWPFLPALPIVGLILTLSGWTPWL